MLKIHQLHASIEDKEILKGVELTIRPGEVHAIMGPNGSGKSTLANVLAGQKDYHITKGTIQYQNQDLLALSPDERAHLGVFLSFQYPVEIPGVSNLYLLKSALNAKRKYSGLEEIDAIDFLAVVREKMKLLHMDDSYLYRDVNTGFSGGEKKRNEILQLLLLEPSLCILDETDSGLDIDALRIVAQGINFLRNSNRSILLITHYQRLLDYIQPDVVHILSEGEIVAEGDYRLAMSLEAEGYEPFCVKSRGHFMNHSMISDALFEAKETLPGWNETERLEAWQRWQKMDIPSSRDEAWKYTSLSRLEKTCFEKAAPTDFELNLKNIPLALSKNRFCFVDGKFKENLSTPLNKNTHLLSRGPWPKINKETQMPLSYFERLNAALMNEGLYLDITTDTVDPIYLVFWYGDRDTNTSHHLRHHIKVQAGVKSHLVIVDGDDNHSTHLATHMIEIELAEGASLDCTHIKKPSNTGYHILHTYAYLAENSQLNHFNFDFGAKLSRNEITVCLKGDASHCQLNGLAIARGLDHIDNQTQINHLAPKTHSLEQYRGIIDDKACHVFHGHVLVNPDASDSIANQHNKNILLTATGQAYTEPQLEIYNQNVQCIHGATVGDIDENALFYLQSRGLNEKQARQWLIFGFARSILDTLDNPALQTELEGWIKTHLALDNTLISDLYRDTSL